MKASDIKVAFGEGIGTLTLAAPERRNAITVLMAEAIIAACDELDASDVAAVVVAAEGPSFCAGADRAVLAAAAERSSVARDQLMLVYRSFARVRALRAPSIAAVRGHAIGAGFNLALSTDLRVVATDASFLAGFFPLGIHPGGGHFALIADRAGPEAAAALGLFSQSLSGEQATRIGIAWEHVTTDNVDARAREIAKAVASDAELARATVKSLRDELATPRMRWSDAVALEAEAQWWSLGRPSVRERVASRAARQR
jgi:enoyl-CoA hydratase